MILISKKSIDLKLIIIQIIVLDDNVLSFLVETRKLRDFN